MNAQENQTTASPAGAEDWEAFCRQPLEAVLRKPTPAYAGVVEEPAREHIRELMSTEYMQQMLTRYTEPEKLVEIADAFREWAESRPAGSSLLLEAEDDMDYCFAGDVHASFDTLLQVWALLRERAAASGRRVCLVLLGDIVDRGLADFPCLAMVEDLLMRGEQDGVRLLCLRGNHDEALWQDPRGNFHSYVRPAGTADALNDLRYYGPAGAAESLGRAAIELARISPCVGELTGLVPEQGNRSLLFAHGGLPHVDLQQEMLEHWQDYTPHTGRPLFDSLPGQAREKWEQDFTWIRLTDRVLHQKPDRGIYGIEMGTQDVNTYRRLHLRLTGRAIGFMLRGHDHEPTGYRLYSYDSVHNPARNKCAQKNCGVLTINTMEHQSGNPRFAHARPALACVRRGGRVEVILLPVVEQAEK